MIPKATNNLNALGTFIQRNHYKTSAYPTNVPQPMDLWYSKQLYGKINRSDDPVFLSEGFLKQVQANDTIFVLNFVADAFEAFRSFMNDALFRGKIEQDSEFAKLNPIKGWTSTNSLWTSYLEVLYQVFNETFVIDLNRNEKIVDFNSFMKVFIEYCERLTPHFPITRSGFILSKFCPHSSSGLVIELAPDKHDDDRNKYEKFLSDPNFTFYAKAAQQFGFLIDKNAPWRLIADLASPAMLRFMRSYNVQLDNLFDDFYYRSHDLDIQVLKVFVRQFYNSFVAANPYANIQKKGLTGGKRTLVERFQRSQISEEQFEQRLGNDFWLRFYSFLRARETEVILSQVQFDKIVRESQVIEKGIDLSAAIDYLSRKFHSVPTTIQDINKENVDLRERVRNVLESDRHRRDFSFN